MTWRSHTHLYTRTLTLPSKDTHRSIHLKSFFFESKVSLGIMCVWGEKMAGIKSLCIFEKEKKRDHFKVCWSFIWLYRNKKKIIRIINYSRLDCQDFRWCSFSAGYPGKLDQNIKPGQMLVLLSGEIPIARAFMKPCRAAQMFFDVFSIACSFSPAISSLFLLGLCHDQIIVSRHLFFLPLLVSKNSYFS